MSRAIDDTVSDFIEKLQAEKMGGFAAGPDYDRHNAARQEHPVSSRLPDHQRTSWFGRIVVATMVLLLVAAGVSYYLYKAEHETIISRIGAILRAPMETSLERRFLALEKQFVDASSVNEVRLQTLEQRQEQLHAPHEQRLHRVEQRLAGLQQPDRTRLQAVENRLVQITARMNDLAAVVAGLSPDEPSGATASAAAVAEPPAVRPLEPVAVARNNIALQQPQSLPKASQDKRQGAGSATVHAGQGSWVINIGSYLYEKTAARKLAEFRQQGVSAELVTATIRSKAIYRIQVPGFHSAAAARDHARQVRTTLGLDETWIRRR